MQNPSGRNLIRLRWKFDAGKLGESFTDESKISLAGIELRFATLHDLFDFRFQSGN